VSHRAAVVTGASGFAGRQLSATLVESGWTVVGTVGRRSAGVPGVQEQRLDVCDVDGLARLLAAVEPSVVFHLAAIVDTVTTPDVEELHRVNTGGTEAVIEAMRRSAPQARLLFTSSAFAYGRTPPEANPIHEEQPLAPVTPYGVSKAAAEAVAARYAEQGGDVVVTRAFQHTGPGHVGAYALADWALQLAQIAATGEPGVIATGNLDVERDYLDVRDVATAYLAAAERGLRGATYNVCSGIPVSMRTLLEGLVRAFALDVEIVTDPARLRTVDQPRVYGDATRLVTDTGWAPVFDLEDTLAALADSARARLASS
jgi:GDP-4-dehydro-6-deoxy-D-mannose reductase